MDIMDRIGWFLALNEEASALFCGPDEKFIRNKYREKSNSEIAVSECIDGRHDTALITKTPPGIMRHFRNAGGIFRIGWPYLNSEITEIYEYAARRERHFIFLVTYHFSGSSTDRGCAGCKLNTEYAKKVAQVFKNDIERVYGYKQGVLCPVLIGIDTDKDSMIIHGDDPANAVDISSSDYDGSEGGKKLQHKLRNILEKTPEMAFKDLLKILMGNYEHTRKVMASNRTIADIEHGEWMIGIGRGFDWFHEHNKAVLVNPYDPDLSKPVDTALHVIQSNIKKGRITDDGFLVVASSVYNGAEQDPVGKSRAEMKAKFFAEFIRNHAMEKYKDLLELMRTITVVNDYNTRKLEIIESSIA